MKVLIIGNGGREHAMAWKCAQSSRVESVWVAPGNAGTALEPKVTNVSIASNDISGLVNFAEKESIDLTIVGPEIPLVLGVVDAFRAKGLACFGPDKQAAQLEGSKAFCKEFLTRHEIPTAKYACFSNIYDAKAYVTQQSTPIVIKADGLAAGKGVVVAMTEQEATQAIESMLVGNIYGEAGHRVIIEEFLQGEEASFIVMTDGKHVLPLATSQDHKARDDGDQGPNTGGMGAYSPAPVITHEIYTQIMNEVILPTVKGMSEDGHPYMGFLYCGLMIDAQGQAKVLEYNCRFGDPETQPILMRLQSDLPALCSAAVNNELHRFTANWDRRAALGVVMTSGGYPGKYKKGVPIEGLDGSSDADTKIFYAGVRSENDRLVTDGGRVLCVTAFGKSVSAAQEKAYQRVEQIHFDQAHYRTDIGYRACQREKTSKS